MAAERSVRSIEKEEVSKRFHLELMRMSLNGEKVMCQSLPAFYSDYRKTPSAAEATEMCAGCPLLELCNEYAIKTRPSGSVFAGVAWSQGRPYAPSARTAKRKLAVMLAA